jgi:hypothetical protein
LQPSITVTGHADLPLEAPERAVSSAVHDAVRGADLLVVDRRGEATRTTAPGEAEIAGATVVVVPTEPGLRPTVEVYARGPVDTPAVEAIRQTIELDACTSAHYDVAARLAAVEAEENRPADGETDDWATIAREAGGTANLPASGTDPGPSGGATEDGSTAVAGGGAADHSVPAAELRARRDSVDEATDRLLVDIGAGDDTAPLAFCGLSEVVDPID